MGITTRQYGPYAKGSRLTTVEMDENFNYLLGLASNVGATGATGATGPAGSSGAAGATGPSGANIYNADGTLTGARTLTLNSNPLTIAGGTTSSRFFANGNFGIGTTADAGYKADINGTARINNVLTTVGTTTSDNPTISSELTTTASGTNWTGTSLSNGYSHTPGSLTSLTSSLNAVVGTFYTITYLLSFDPDGGAGSITSFTFGGVTLATTPLETYINTTVLATTTAPVVITPTSDYNGTVTVSVKSVTASSASILYKRSDGTTVNEFRANSLNSNVFFGLSAGANTYNSAQNTFIGSLAGQYNVNGTSNTFIGYLSGNKNDGYQNVFIGALSGNNNSSGIENTFIGYQSGTINTIGIQNVFIGFTSGRNNTSGSQNVFAGDSAGYNNTTGQYNVNIGYGAGNSNFTGSGNICVGHLSGRTNSSSNNTFVGYLSAYNNTTGSSNVSIGPLAGYNNTTGSSTVAIGSSSGLSNTASQNTFVGDSAGYNNYGQTQNTYIGYRAGFGVNATNQSNNTYVGYSVGSVQTDAYQNTCMGTLAARNILTTNNMVAIGYNAARYYGALNSNNSAGGSSGVYIGSGSSPLTNSTSNEIAFGYNTIGLGTNTVALGNDSVTLTALKGSVIIGATVVNAAAILQADSTTKGFLPPRMTTAQKNAISTPPAGLVVYDTDLNKLCVRAASAWQTITSV
jgi:hypothetical protein